MSDVFTSGKRSDVMSRIRSKGNKDTELRLMALMREGGIKGWRRHCRIKTSWKGAPMRIRPDFVFHRQKVAVFVDGCFWHGCPKHATWPKQNGKFWSMKIRGNMARDLKVARALRSSGWKVIRIWEHRLKKPNSALSRIRKALAAAGIEASMETQRISLVEMDSLITSSGGTDGHVESM